MADGFAPDSNHTVRLQRRFAADPQAVFDAWTVPWSPAAR